MNSRDLFDFAALMPPAISILFPAVTELWHARWSQPQFFPPFRILEQVSVARVRQKYHVGGAEHAKSPLITS